MKKIQSFSSLIGSPNEYIFQKFSKKNRKFKIKIPRVGEVFLIKFLFKSSLKNAVFSSKTFLGRCIFLKRKNLNTALICLRNIYNRYPIELRFFLHSPYISNLIYIKRKFYRRNNISYFRKLSVFKSKV